MSKPEASQTTKTSRQAPDLLPYAITLEVRDRCLCLSLQRAARLAARRFDAALRPFGLTNGQFSLLMALNRAEPPGLGSLAALLAMDHTTLTANLKPLARRRLLQSLPDPADARRRRLRLTDAGRRLLVAALPAWRSSEEAVEQAVGDAAAPSLRALLSRLS